MSTLILPLAKNRTRSVVPNVSMSDPLEAAIRSASLARRWEGRSWNRVVSQTTIAVSVRLSQYSTRPS